MAQLKLLFLAITMVTCLSLVNADFRCAGSVNGFLCFAEKKPHTFVIRCNTDNGVFRFNIDPRDVSSPAPNAYLRLQCGIPFPRNVPGECYFNSLQPMQYILRSDNSLPACGAENDMETAYT